VVIVDPEGLSADVDVAVEAQVGDAGGGARDVLGQTVPQRPRGLEQMLLFGDRRLHPRDLLIEALRELGRRSWAPQPAKNKR
jgi:hypothetical protein